MTLAEAILHLAEVEDQRKKLVLDHARAMDELDRLEKQCLAIRATAGAGFDTGKIALARSVLAITGRYAKAGADRSSCLSEAMRQIAGWQEGRTIGMCREFVGTKVYAHWIGQRSDHPYGMGPRHGGIIFSIGLKKSIRIRDPFHLTDAERDACLYYLNAIEKIEDVEAQAEQKKAG